MGLFRLMTVCAFVASAGLCAAADTPMSGEWNFADGSLKGVNDGAPLEYFDGADGETARQTEFKKASEFSLPLIGGKDATVMHFPKCSPKMGFVMPTGFDDDASTRPVGYTVLMDLCYKTIPTTYSALMQNDPKNSNDATVFSVNGGIGCRGVSDGQMVAKTWYRVVWTVDNRFVLRKYIDGRQVGTQPLSEKTPELWRAGSRVLLFTDNDNQTADGYVARIVVRDGVLSHREVMTLGGFEKVKPALLTGPFLQNMQKDSMTIMWETETDQDGSVEYGLTAKYGTKVPSTKYLSKASTTIHTAVLEGLKPGTKYHYCVHNDGLENPTTPDAVFETAPDSNTGDFRFGFWSDSQGEVDGSAEHPTVDMFKHMAKQDIAFGLTAGDLAEAGDSLSCVRRFYLDRTCKYLGTSKPFFTAWGNHDAYHTLATGEINYIRENASMPSKTRTDNPGKVGAGRGAFSFTYRGVYFVCFDDQHPDDITNGWFDAELKKPECTEARMRIAVIHQPPYCEMWTPGSETYQKELVPRLEKNRFSLCLSGHTHEYERGEKNGVTYVISGGMSWLDLTEPIVKDWPFITVGGAHNMDGASRAGLFHEYTLFSVTGNKLVGKMQAFKPDGTYIGVKDSFTIPMPENGKQD
ncbi:hypothetical protein GX645_01365 [Candidatus Sumerlaeota bacterium]|nr:hypothetical protein [Candidatus Sumerlaeota bacterium]